MHFLTSLIIFFGFVLVIFLGLVQVRRAEPQYLWILPVIDIGVTLPFLEIRFQTFPSNESQYAAREYLLTDG
jgi:hypothetical protein